MSKFLKNHVCSLNSRISLKTTNSCKNQRARNKKEPKFDLFIKPALFKSPISGPELKQNSIFFCCQLVSNNGWIQNFHSFLSFFHFLLRKSHEVLL